MILALALAATQPCTVQRVTDGDTIRCHEGPSLRIAGVDAADRRSSGRCRPFRKPGAWCDDAAYARHKAALRQILAGHRVTWRQVDANPCRPGFQADPYAFRGRIVAVVMVEGRSVAPLMLAAGAREWRCR